MYSFYLQNVIYISMHACILYCKEIFFYYYLYIIKIMMHGKFINFIILGPYYICSAHFITVEPLFNEPLYNEVLCITNDNYSPARPNLQ